MLLEVGGEFIDATKVGGSSTALEKQDGVELGEEGGGRLVDGAEYGLTGCDELLEERDNDKGRLSIETRGGFIQEEDGRAGNEFDGDGESFSLLDTEAGTRYTNDGVLDVVKLEKFDDLVDVGDPLFVGGRLGLSESCRKLECLANGRLRQVDV